jgi:hypothetical protein
MRFEFETWASVTAAKIDRDTLQPLQLGFSLLTSENFAEGYKKFVGIRRRLGSYVNMAVMTPLLQEDAKDITLWDNDNRLLGNLDDENSLSQLITSNCERINHYNPGTLRVQFKDNSSLRYKVPIVSRLEVDQSDPTSINY